MSVTILQGDCLQRLRELPDESVHCCVTSPPYWGLRDYGVAGQMGLEATLGEHMDGMVALFREVRRVLRKDGTCWVNYGDAYASAPNGRSAADTKAAGNDDRTFRDKPISTVGPIYDPNHEKGSRVGASGNKGNSAADHRGRVVAEGVLKPKDRMMMPARLAIALQEDGWWLRDEIIWHKPNPMPSSVKDRTTPAHEMIYLLSKSSKYYFDQEAIKEPASENTHARKAGANSRINVDRVPRPRKSNKQQATADASNASTKRTMGGFNERWDAKERKIAEAGSGIKNNSSFQKAVEDIVPFRNKRSVWTVAPKAFTEAHFATFPPALIEPCILAGAPEGGTVLDPFFGAGTTGLVCQQLKRNCIGIELNPEYVKIAQKRLGLFAASETVDALLA